MWGFPSVLGIQHTLDSIVCPALTANESGFFQNRFFGINSGSLLNKWLKICSLLYLKFVPSWVLVMLQFSAENLTLPLRITLEIPCFFTSYYFLFLKKFQLSLKHQLNVTLSLLLSTFQNACCASHNNFFMLKFI